MLRRLSLLLYFITVCHFLAGQQLYREGYLLQSPLDTVKGEIKYISYNQAASRCVFRDTVGNETTYLPEDIYGYGIGKELVFHTKEVLDKGPIFLDVIYQGTVTLYTYRDTNQRNYFFAGSDESGQFSQLIQKTVKQGRRQRVLKPYVDVLKIMLPEHQLIAYEIEHTPLTAKGLSQLLIAYDERYANTKGIAYTGFRQKTPPSLAIIAGQHFSNLTLNGHSGKDRNSTFALGIRVEKEISRNTGRLFINADLIVSSERYSGIYDAEQVVNTGGDLVSNFINITVPASFVGVFGPIQYRTTAELERTFINLPIHLKYKLPGRRFNVTFGGGLEAQYATSDEVLVNGQILQNGNIEVGIMSVEDANPFRIGINAGLGISYNGKRTMFLDIRHSPAWFDQGALNYAYTRMMLGVSLTRNKTD